MSAPMLHSGMSLHLDLRHFVHQLKLIIPCWTANIMFACHCQAQSF